MKHCYNCKMYTDNGFSNCIGNDPMICDKWKEYNVKPNRTISADEVVKDWNTSKGMATIIKSIYQLETGERDKLLGEILFALQKEIRNEK